MFSALIDKIKGKVPAGMKRNPQWPRIRKQHLIAYPRCEACGGKDDLEIHHIQPFHLNPNRELSFTNLITLCESKKNGVNCHLFFGHLGNFRSYNEFVAPDCVKWKYKITTRPRGE